MSLLGLQLLTDAQLVGVDARIEVLDGLQRDAGLLGDGTEVLALGDDVFARTRSGSALAVSTLGGGLRSGSDFLESGDLVSEGLLVGGEVGETR